MKDNFNVDYIYETKVRFTDVDSYQIVHHSKYFIYMEEARFECVKDSFSINPNELEEKGVLFLVLSSKCKYIKSALLGDKISVHLKLDMEDGTRLTCYYRLYNQNKDLLCRATIILGYYSQSQGKLLHSHPKWLVEKMASLHM